MLRKMSRIPGLQNLKSVIISNFSSTIIQLFSTLNLRYIVPHIILLGI